MAHHLGCPYGIRFWFRASLTGQFRFAGSLSWSTFRRLAYSYISAHSRGFQSPFFQMQSVCFSLERFYAIHFQKYLIEFGYWRSYCRA